MRTLFAISSATALSFFMLASCSTNNSETALVPVVQKLACDLPVRRSELIKLCGLRGLVSQRHYIGRRGGWAGASEDWSMPDGSTLIGRFLYYEGHCGIIPDTLPSGESIAKQSGSTVDFPFLGNPPKQPDKQIWFNELILTDTKGKPMFSEKKLPVRVCKS